MRNRKILIIGLESFSNFQPICVTPSPISVVGPQSLLIDELQVREHLTTYASATSHTLDDRQLCDLELLLDGSFSPLSGFMNEADYTDVVHNMRLADGQLFPIPITLDIPPHVADKVAVGEPLVLRDIEGKPLAVLHVESKYTPNLAVESQMVYGTTDRAHPAVNWLAGHSQETYVGGRLEGYALPEHNDFCELRSTPAQTRAALAASGATKVVAFQTRNPMHRAHVELTMRAAREHDATVLIHPVVGMTKPGDVDHYSRVRCYRKVLPYYSDIKVQLNLLGLAMRMGGPREGLLHGIVRKNHGCTHFIVGRDHAGPGKGSDGKDLYGPYDAQEMFQEHQAELGIEMVPFQMLSYVPAANVYKAADEVQEGEETVSISGTEIRHRLQNDLDIPEWFSYPEVVSELRRTYPSPSQKGVVLFFTGLSGAGKSTIARRVVAKLMETGDRSVAYLDGDHVRQMLSKGLGFSAEDRDLNIRRIGYVASLVAAASGVAVCAPIAPYAKTRHEARMMANQLGAAFMEVYVSTPVSECAQRDVKGLYAKAYAGEIKNFTGVSDPYEVPENPEISLDTLTRTADELATDVLEYLQKGGYIQGV